jgi:hypothetical protein
LKRLEQSELRKKKEYNCMAEDKLPASERSCSVSKNPGGEGAPAAERYNITII